MTQSRAPLSLPSGRVFSLLAYRSMGAATGTLQTLYATRDGDAFEKVVQAVKDASFGQPKMRPGTRGNMREIGVLAIDSSGTAEGFVRARLMEKLPDVGQRFQSIGDAARFLGLGPQSLRVVMSRARLAADGFDVAVTVRGIRLAYTDSAAWLTCGHAGPENRAPGAKFEDTKLGGRRTAEEVARALGLPYVPRRQP